MKFLDGKIIYDAISKASKLPAPIDLIIIEEIRLEEEKGISGLLVHCLKIPKDDIRIARATTVDITQALINWMAMWAETGTPDVWKGPYDLPT
jgi:hypothetical protein